MMKTQDKVPAPRIASQNVSWIAACLGLVSLLAYFGSIPSHREWLGGWDVLSLPPFWGGVALFMGCVFWWTYFRFPGPPGEVKDVGPRSAKWLFGILLSVGVVSRFVHLPDAQGLYDIDQIASVRAVSDVADGRFILIDLFGTRPALACYLTAAVWKTVPFLSAAVAIKLTNAICDVAVLCLAYLVGRSWRNRRAGLFLMGLWVVSRPVLYKVYWGGYDFSLTTLAVIGALGGTVWALRKPNHRRCLIWGGLITVGVYVNLFYRPWLPFLAMGTGWILWSRKDARRDWGGSAWAYVGLLTLGWFYLFLASHGVGIGREKLFTDPERALLVLGLVGLSAWTLFKALRGWGRREGSALAAWGSGALLSLGLYALIAVHPLFATRLAGHEMWKTKMFLAEPWFVIKARIWKLFEFLATSGGDFETLSNAAQPFFDLGTGLAVMAGVAWVLARPTRLGLGLFFFAMMSCANYVISVVPHSGRLYTCLFPFLALASMALEEAWGRFRLAFPGVRAGALGSVALLIVGGGIFWANYQDVWDWMRRENTASMMARMAREAPASSRVVLVTSPWVSKEAVEQNLKGRKVVWWDGEEGLSGPFKDASGIESRVLVPVDRVDARKRLERITTDGVWREGKPLDGSKEVKVFEMFLPSR
jgi:hypothetical protein